VTPGIAVVIVNYGSHALLERNFPSAKWQSIDAHFFVVDNFTTESELTALRLVADRRGWTVVASPRNVGFGSGVNLGVAAAIEQGYGCLLLLNPDLLIDDQVGQALAQQVAQSPMTMVSPRIVTSTGKLWFDGGQLDLTSGRVRTAVRADMAAPFAWLTGACVALSVQLWEETGGFDPDYFLYWEDVDFSQRVVQAGGKLLVRTDLKVVHEVGGTQGAGKSAVYLRYNTANRLLFAAKWLPRDTANRWVRHTPRESYRVLTRGGRRSLARWESVRAAVVGSARGVQAVRHAGTDTSTRQAPSEVEK
jgi:N-acetylglucosaminyl-diphospho-decaprenol L-rhamnosyltransferase